MTSLFALLLLASAASVEPALAGGPDGGAAPAGAVLTDHARRGMTFERLDGLAGESAAACAAVCATRPACAAWTWRTGWAGRAARCDLHGAAATPAPHPGAVTGLAPALAARIEAAAERAPTAREQRALLQADGVLSPTRDTLDGG
ncbi:MAG: PAN domain-containing protein [Oceanicaulis sp.]